MKILIIGINFHPELTGIGKYTGEMSVYLAEQGHEICVITTPPYYPYWHVQKPYHSWQYRKEKWNGIYIIRCPLWVPKKLTGFKRILHLFSFAFSSIPILISKINWHPDILINIAPAFTTSQFSILFARFVNAKTWLHIQDFEIDAAQNLNMLPIWLTKFALNIENIIIKQFNKVSTISPGMLKRLHLKGISDSKTLLFPNWVDTQKIYPINKGGHKKFYGFQKDDFIALYSGNMGHKQGLEILIEVAQYLIKKQNIKLVLAGDGAAREDLEKKARKLPNVYFLPLQPIEKFNLLLNLADIHLLPQLKDVTDLVLPSKITGMLASGRPIVGAALEDSQLGEILSKTGILVPPGNSVAFAEAIHKLALDKTLRYSLGEKARYYAEFYFDKNKILSKFHDELLRFCREKN